LKPINQKEQAAKLSVISNTSLVIGKLTIGVAIGSVGVMSEGIHSSLDLLAAIIAFLPYDKHLILLMKNIVMDMEKLKTSQVHLKQF